MAMTLRAYLNQELKRKGKTVAQEKKKSKR